MPRPFREQIKNIFERWFETINEINQKYAKPRIKMTKAVSFSLLVLRIYLLILVGLLVYKFYTLVTGH